MIQIRRAVDKDIPRLHELLGQVLQIHAEIRPDIFISGTTKYTDEELREMIRNEEKPIYVAADEQDVCVGYAFCQLRQQPFSNNMVPFQSLFIDDLCVDEKMRGQHVGESLFAFVKEEAKRLGCYEVTLNVWEGNTSAEKFYEKALPYLRKVIHKDNLDLKTIAELVRTRIEIFPDMEEMVSFFEELPEYSADLFENKKQKATKENSLQILEELLPLFESAERFTNDALFEIIAAYAEAHGFKNKTVIWAVRIAVSGREVTPAGATQIMEILGKEESLFRIRKAISLLGA